VLDFKGSGGPVKGVRRDSTRDRRSDTMRNDANTLPPLPKSAPTARKSQDRESSKARKDSKSKKSSSKTEEKRLKTDKYAHLPVYDKEEEQRKARQREKEMSKMFNDMNDQLEDITKLTSSHMEKRGVNLTASPFDDEPAADTVDVHTIKYSKGVLNQRNSECRTQVVKQNESNNKKDNKSNDKLVEKEVEVSIKNNNTEVIVVESEEEFEPIEVSPIERVVFSANSGELNKPEKRALIEGNTDIEMSAQTQSNQGEDDITYERLGKKFTDLTAKMESVSKNLKEQDIPFIDSEEADNRLELEIEEVLADNLDLGMEVSRIQLETSPSKENSSAALVVAHRKCKGTDTVHMSTKTVRREYSDI